MRGVVMHTPMGHEYGGVVQKVGSEVNTVRPGDFVVGSRRRRPVSHWPQAPWSPLPGSPAQS